jgi:predicted MPP superfamily phosphohydrolase
MRHAIAHIADIHYRKEEPEGASTIFNALLKDLRKQKESLAKYEFYLAITGDIVSAGKDNDSYSSFDKEFNYKLNEIGLTRDYRMIVPGNHDIDQCVVEKDFKNYQDKINNNIDTERKFNDFISDKNFQDNKFENYMLFESDFAKYGIHYSPYGKGWILNNTLGVFCLNTSLCSFGGVNGVADRDKLAVFTRGLIEWCNNLGTSTNILLMHHPISHLISWSKDAMKQIIENKFSLCLCGHNHEQDVFYNKISHKSLICSAPQVFTDKSDLLGYAIILIEDNYIDKIIYREYAKGQFFNGQRFSENSEGVVNIQSNYLKSIEVLEHNLKTALSFFKGQPQVFVEPKISKDREFNNEPNLLDEIIGNPRPSIIVSHPQFGLTCLSHHMRLEAYKINNFWIYLDSKHIKARIVESAIDSQLKEFDKKKDDIKCIIIDSWDSSIIDHRDGQDLLDSIETVLSGSPLRFIPRSSFSAS